MSLWKYGFSYMLSTVVIIFSLFLNSLYCGLIYIQNCHRFGQWKSLLNLLLCPSHITHTNHEKLCCFLAQQDFPDSFCTFLPQRGNHSFPRLLSIWALGGTVGFHCSWVISLNRARKDLCCFFLFLFRVGISSSFLVVEKSFLNFWFLTP